MRTFDEQQPFQAAVEPYFCTNAMFSVCDGGTCYRKCTIRRMDAAAG